MGVLVEVTDTENIKSGVHEDKEKQNVASDYEWSGAESGSREN